MTSSAAGSTADITPGRSGAPPIDWLIAALIAGWCLLGIVGYPDDIALSWDETDHVGALFHYKAFFTAVLQPNVRQVPWTELGSWGAGLDYYPPTYALLLGLVSAVFGVSMTEVRLFTILQGGLTLWLLERCIRRSSTRTVARWAVGLLALNPWFRVFSRRLMLDVPQVCFLVGCFYYLICVETKTEPVRPIRFLLLSLPWFAFAALTRITAAPFLLASFVLWIGLRRVQRTPTAPSSLLRGTLGFVPIAVACLTLGIWLLTSHALKSSLALHGHRSFLTVLLEQSSTYLRWLFFEMDPFWGLLWAAGVGWCLWRRTSLHLLTLAILVVTHLTIASLHNPAGMDFRFYLPVMPFLCFAAADMLASGAASLLRFGGLRVTPHPVWTVLGTISLLLTGTWRYLRDDARRLEATSSGVLQAIRGALPHIQPRAAIGIGEASEAKFFLAMLGAPTTYRLDERLGRFRHVAELPLQWDWLIFDRAELDRSPHFQELLEEVRHSLEWRLEASAAGSPTELTHAEGASGFVFQRVVPSAAWSGQYADRCAEPVSQEGLCRRAVSASGLVAAGPVSELEPGTYEGHVTLRASEIAPGDERALGRIEITSNARRNHIADVPILRQPDAAGGMLDVAFQVTLPTRAFCEFLVWSSGASTLEADSVVVTRHGDPQLGASVNAGVVSERR